MAEHTTSPKKGLSTAILRILQAHTDEQHPLRYEALIQLLETEYSLTATRKSVQTHIAALQDMGFPLHYQKGWYCAPLFTAGELNILLDSLAANTCLPDALQQSLRERLCSLGGAFFTPAEAAGADRPRSQQFSITLEALRQAIAQGRQVSFHYGNYDVDKRLHPRLDSAGKAKLYRINPYRLATVSGRYYLVCNVDKYASLCHFRMDRILDIRVLKRSAKPLSQVEGAEDGLPLEDYLNLHPYMYTGKARSYRLQLERRHINDIIDWFGLAVSFDNVSDTSCQALITSDPLSMEIWLKRYGDHVKVL